ncbi:non-hydrolyzing UDP-N-acetylglucosamine 2-epimerase [Adhaeretor mobilis]|uniref:UDP-N-acetylglucosamine 2-epimerase (non-hydrolyzing) n=1 Tax=Adhaeretor mobilis TaxID=1930276 RepID=A0A517MRK8_9BACT|nr:UDP-N-acetylglucosamine 2-epimerase (non-hydrolyzing) [Adhaeretor mobilis]QDS97522.1 UDP-N-acetylglucosamine 2-epimerase [Adhaeretor mobilis]
MHQVAVFIGTRPEAIKMAPVVATLNAAEGIQPVVVNAGQHREMIRQVIELFGIPVDVDLDVMVKDQTLAGLTSRLVTRIDETLSEIKPDLVLVQGDTTTVLCAALASFYNKIPIGHVEAGLRTGNMQSPFPEEANRRLVSPLADLHFAPTDTARDALLAERIPAERILVTGNTVIDALLMEVARQEQPEVADSLAAELAEIVGESLIGREMILITGHRRENIGEGFLQICHAIRELATRRPDALLVYPVHLNPRVKDVVHKQLADLANVRLIAPQPYTQFVALARASRLILTDSGGVQEEAPSLGKPVLVMRDTTERPEGVEAGAVRLVGPNADRIVSEAMTLLTDEATHQAMARTANPYGDGQAAERIVQRVREFLQS